MNLWCEISYKMLQQLIIISFIWSLVCHVVACVCVGGEIIFVCVVGSALLLTRVRVYLRELL